MPLIVRPLSTCRGGWPAIRFDAFALVSLLLHPQDAQCPLATIMWHGGAAADIRASADPGGTPLYPGAGPGPLRRACGSLTGPPGGLERLYER